jgi:hypothetical protein
MPSTTKAKEKTTKAKSVLQFCQLLKPNSGFFREISPPRRLTVQGSITTMARRLGYRKKM